MLSAWAKLQEWYVSRCNGDWEHYYGVTIETLDNPGWLAQIYLENTYLKTREFAEVKIERSEHDWIHASTRTRSAGPHIVGGRVFYIACGPKNMEEALDVFTEWAGYPNFPREY